MRGTYFLSHRRREWVAVVHGAGDGVIRMRKIDKTGPFSHMDYRRDGVGCYSIWALAAEIAADWTFDPAAERKIAEWERGPAWERGVWGMANLMVWNELVRLGAGRLATKFDILARKARDGQADVEMINEIGLRFLRYAREGAGSK